MQGFAQGLPVGIVQNTAQESGDGAEAGSMAGWHVVLLRVTGSAAATAGSNTPAKGCPHPPGIN
ncbi:hypothetical protein GCM10010524_38150 [Streptomyces mexicanus]